jgi:hypothetical protein
MGISHYWSGNQNRNFSAPDLLCHGASRISSFRRLRHGRVVLPGMARKCHLHDPGKLLTFSSSSSGGGLFGRPVTRKGPGRFLFGGTSS